MRPTGLIGVATFAGLAAPAVATATLLATLWSSGCGGESEPSNEPVSPSSSEISTVPATPFAPGETIQLNIREVSHHDAMAELTNRLDVDSSERRSRCFRLLRVDGGSMAPSPTSSEVESLIRFLEAYGVLLSDSGTIPTEPVQLELMRDPSPYKSGGDEGVVVLFRQRVDGFLKQDSLIGGRFVGNELRLVGGCIHEPRRSPARLGALVVPDADVARAAFRSELGADKVEDTSRVRGFIWIEKGRAEWVFQGHHIDALTGDYLGVPEDLPSDPIVQDTGSTMGGTP